MWRYRQSQDNNDWLAHFGIFGMRWGIRRFQNTDGTLTEEGKKRYRKEDIDRDIREKIESHPEKANSIKKRSDQIIEKADKLSEHYGKAFKSMKLSDDEKEKVWADLHKDFGVGTDDPEFFDFVVGTKIGKLMWHKIPKSVQNEREEFTQFQDEYWKDVKTFSDDLIKEYEGSSISEIYNGTTDGKQYAKIAVSDNLNTSFPVFIWRHFDDHWVLELKEFTECEDRLCEEFTASEYNRRYGRK